MRKYKTNSSDALFDGSYVQDNCQKYMDLYGTYENKKPFPEDEKNINNLIGKDDFKAIRKNIKDSCKEIRKVFKDMNPKHYRDDLPDDEE